jgi:hypothetical protein
MAKSKPERDADLKAKKNAHGLIWRGHWEHYTITEKVARYVARENKKAIKIDE